MTNFRVWKNAMELLKSHFRRAAGLLENVYFKDFGTLEFERYLSLRTCKSTKKTWFFSIDLGRGGKTTRYLFFFGHPKQLHGKTDVSLHVCILPTDIPADFAEIGYSVENGNFITAWKTGPVQNKRINDIMEVFFESMGLSYRYS